MMNVNLARLIERLVDLQHLESVDGRQTHQVFMNPAHAALCGLKDGDKVGCPLGEIEIRLDVNVANKQLIPCMFSRGMEHSFLREPMADAHMAGCLGWHPTRPEKPAEAPCRACSRMNDVGVKVCWCCGGAPQ